MKALYYNYYLFYKKIWKDNDASFTTRLSLSFLESLFINGVFQILLAYFFCKKLPLSIKLGIALALLLINTYIIFTSRNEKKIINSNPEILNSSFFSRVFAILFFLYLHQHYFGYLIMQTMLSQTVIIKVA